jgi:hypothetical protein
MNLLAAINDANLFKRWLGDPSWAPWRAFLGALFGLEMSDEQLAVFKQCTGRTTAPTAAFTEAWLVCGRRGGKSSVLALVAVYLACFRDYREHLAPGEIATIRIMAADRAQARTIFRYVGALLRETPLLERLIERELAESFELSNRVSIEIGTASFKSVRGYSFAGVLCDEIAFWQSDEGSTNPDEEVLAALRPGLVTLPGAMLLCASSPYARKGALWAAFQRWHGKDDAPVLIWHAPTRTMNSSVPEEFIARELEKDHPRAAAEYLAEFRTDVESFVSLDAVRGCIGAGCRERGPSRQWRYWGFCDPSGGSNDAMTLAVAHREGNTVILDLVRERRPPFSPEAVVEEFAGVLRAYRCTSVVGDRYAGEWPRERFRIHFINYEVAEKSKSELYQSLLPLLNSRAIDLLDSDRLLHQLVGLERRTARGGKDSIDHARGAHDDLANAAAGAVELAASRPSGWRRERMPQPAVVTLKPRVVADGSERGAGWMARR